MKIHLVLILILIFYSCSDKKNRNAATEREGADKQLIENSEFQSILDAANVHGAVLIYDSQKEVYYSNDFLWADKGNLPASTFKIANSIIALESGVVEDDSTLFEWDGKKRALKVWEQDLIFREAFHFSCVPCYQDVARAIGEQRMNDYLAKLDYGDMEVNSSNIDVFWLKGASRITQFQQIDFLKRFYHSELPVSERTEEIMKRMMVIGDSDHYRISGKTGWSNSTGTDNGWFVGYIELRAKVYFFATNVEPDEQFDMDKFPMIRKEVTYKALKQMGII